MRLMRFNVMGEYKLNYCSTRNENIKVTAAQAIIEGLSDDGGLFVPCNFPLLNYKDCLALSYSQLAAKLISLYLTDYDEDFLKQAAIKAYGEKFNALAGETKKVCNNLFSLELWHGPTSAFKDYALQLMPHLLVEAKKITNDNSLTKILVATSGDTGKAALDGYCDLPSIKIAVFYPLSGTSEVQRLQMATQQGDNVCVYAVKGNFDDAQTGVKKAFMNKALRASCECKGERLSSANSINWGRLVPQIVYYYYSYIQLVNKGEINAGDKIDYCVPTGNFGDILAGYYAKQMGLPIGRLICASNKNNVLTEFMQTGTYNAKRDFYKTSSPSMDILISSNLERLLYHVTKSSKTVAEYMQSLAENGLFTVSKEVLAKIQDSFDCGWASDEAATETIKKIYNDYKYLCDTHTAIAFKVLENTSTDKTCVVVSTASPYKFSGDVLNALKKVDNINEFEAMAQLNEITGIDIPKALSKLLNEKVRFEEQIGPEEIIGIALKI